MQTYGAVLDHVDCPPTEAWTASTAPFGRCAVGAGRGTGQALRPDVVHRTERVALMRHDAAAKGAESPCWDALEHPQSLPSSGAGGDTNCGSLNGCQPPPHDCRTPYVASI